MKQIPLSRRVLADNPDLYKRAEENLKAVPNCPSGLGCEAMLGDKAGDETLKAKPKVPPKPRSKGDKATLSAAQAGKVATRQKPARGLRTNRATSRPQRSEQ